MTGPWASVVFALAFSYQVLGDMTVLIVKRRGS